MIENTVLPLVGVLHVNIEAKMPCHTNLQDYKRYD
jgi:hypothetical protein